MGNKIRLKVVTPTRVLFDDDVDMLIMRTVEGDMGVLYGHQPLSTVLSYGALRIMQGEGEKQAAVLGGFAEITPKLVTVLSTVAEWSDEIDVERAKQSMARAEARMKSTDTLVNVKRAEAAFRRAVVRIETSSYSILKGKVR